MKNKIIIQYFKIPLGELILGSYENKLCLCDWRYRKKRDEIDKRIQQGLYADYEEGDSPVLQATRKQIEAYLKGERSEFDIPLQLVGTDFQKSVWNTLLKIPHGETETYLGLSKSMNKASSIRAVAAANGANAISIIIPCHRIIGSRRNLVGYAGGLTAKMKLLELEGRGRAPDPWELF